MNNDDKVSMLARVIQDAMKNTVDTKAMPEVAFTDAAWAAMNITESPEYSALPRFKDKP